jgi:predicted hotdog family 3-hydroxylacyl-ACP dehydratase
MSAYPPIRELVPHRSPMLVLEEVLQHHDRTIVCRARVEAGSPFVRDGVMPAVTLLEHMAQATAAWLGLRALARGGRIGPGVLGGSRQVELDVDELRVGDELEVRAEHIWGEGQVASFSCEVLRRGIRVAAARVSVHGGEPSS